MSMWHCEKCLGTPGVGVGCVCVAQSAASAEPSDEEIQALAKQHLWAHAQNVGAGDVCVEGEVAFARALLSRYGRPAGDAQPMRWLVTGKCGNDEYTRAADEAQRAKQLRVESYCGEDGTQVVPLYAAPVAAQKVDDARDAERYRWLIDSDWYVGPPPEVEGVWVACYDHNATKHGVTQAIDAAMQRTSGGEK